MATLTYDPTPADQPEFNEAEQEALAIGEAAAEEQQQLLAGKFKDAEALEKAYIELQSKLGSRSNEQDAAQEEATDEVEEVLEEDEESASNILEALWEQGLNGKFEEDTLKELTNLSSADLAKMYLEYRAEAEKNSTSATDDVTDNDLNELRQIAGGDDEYGSMLSWASENLSPEEIDRYDAVMENGDKNAMSFAVEALFNRYQDAVGVEGKLLTGKATTSTKDVFRSQAEVVAAMSDSRYDRDPAYRQDVFAKLERSNLEY